MKEPIEPINNNAFVALLHGDADEYFMYAFVLAGQLRKYSADADRVLLLGPGHFGKSLDIIQALRFAGWTHLHHVNAIDKPHLDKTARKRHRYVFLRNCLPWCCRTDMFCFWIWIC